MGRIAKTAIERQLEELEDREKHLSDSLPHRHAWKWYEWAWNFYCSTNKNNFICAANQISKSSTQIRKCIEWAGNPDLWPKLWTIKPTQFWYFYNTKDVATIEFKEKWVKEFLPRNEFKDHPTFGWKPDFQSKQIFAIYFNSGVSVYFKSYEQGQKFLQSSSVFALFADEEMPVEVYDEINIRRAGASVSGYFHMVFTATLGQEFWRETIEEKGEHERFKDALKRQVSMYDCLKYRDGTDSPWTIEKIEEIKRSCRDEAEIQRRVYGRFVVDTDRKYPGFVRSKNLKPDHKLPKNWLIYAGVDIGSGGSAHPAAIVFLAVNQDFTKGRIFMCWRGDRLVTTAGDILAKYRMMKGNLPVIAAYYDSQSKDFFTVASRMGEPFQKADKGREIGEDLLNVLFKNEVLIIYDNKEGRKLAVELENLTSKTTKANSKDDLIDATRFACTRVPWNFAKIYGKQIEETKVKDPKEDEPRYRHYKGLDRESDGLDLLEAEFVEINDDYEYYGYD